MGIFNRKKKEQIKQRVCNHKWKDFHWYLEATYFKDDGGFQIKVIEPYVCIYCKERKDVVLREQRTYCTRKEASEICDNWEEKYQEHLKDKALVEDEIHDMILVDKEYLELYNKVINPAG